MTEDQFQETKEIMKKANYWRGMITVAKSDVSKWTNIEDSYRRDFKPERADGAKKMLLKALDILDKRRKKFADIKLPEEKVKIRKTSGHEWLAKQDEEEFQILIESTKRI